MLPYVSYKTKTVCTTCERRTNKQIKSVATESALLNKYISNLNVGERYILIQQADEDMNYHKGINS